jgi:hypothetical protein
MVRARARGHRGNRRQCGYVARILCGRAAALYGQHTKRPRCQVGDPSARRGGLLAAAAVWVRCALVAPKAMLTRDLPASIRPGILHYVIRLDRSPWSVALSARAFNVEIPDAFARNVSRGAGVG